MVKDAAGDGGVGLEDKIQGEGEREKCQATSSAVMLLFILMCI